MNIVMLGAPGAGKGTQAARISKRFNIPHISTGDIFRKNISEQTPVGLEAKGYIDKGRLVPDDVTVRLVKSRISEPDCENGYILDGFPRTIPQAQALEKIADIDCVVSIEIKPEKLISRLMGRRVCESCAESYHTEFLQNEETCAKCGGKLVRRKDDNPETIKERLEVYATETAPLKEYYTERDVLFTVISEGGMDAVEGRIAQWLNKHKNNDND